MTDNLPGVLVLCTGNSARSILGEAMLANLGEGRLRAWSAGSRPKGVPHPGALRLLARRGIDIATFRSKSWNEFTVPGAPRIDIAITVCDNAAQEACPVFIGAPVKGHWGLPDPADVEAATRPSMPRSRQRGRRSPSGSARCSPRRSRPCRPPTCRTCFPKSATWTAPHEPRFLGRGNRQLLPVLHGDRFGDHGRATCRRKCRGGAAGQHDRHRGHALRADRDARSAFGRALQSGGDAGVPPAR